jgi:hypothetical protein
MNMNMDMEQRQVEHVSLLTRFYVFLRDRDARIVELFFWALNVYILALVVLVPQEISLPRFLLRITFQLTTTMLNTLALSLFSRRIRMASAIANTFIMTFITVSMIYAQNANAGTYALLGLLSIFVCWKINIK